MFSVASFFNTFNRYSFWHNWKVSQVWPRHGASIALPTAIAMLLPKCNGVNLSVVLQLTASNGMWSKRVSTMEGVGMTISCDTEGCDVMVEG